MPFRNALAIEMDHDVEDGPSGFVPRDVTERWTVADDGLEHGRTGYFIEREELDRRRPDGLWFWPMHMLEKAWCAPDAFADAFRRAVAAYGLQADRDLEASFLAAARAKAEIGLWTRAAREVGLRRTASEPVGLGELAKAGAEVCLRRTSGRVVGGHGPSAARRRRHG